MAQTDRKIYILKNIERSQNYSYQIRRQCVQPRVCMDWPMAPVTDCCDPTTVTPVATLKYLDFLTTMTTCTSTHLINNSYAACSIILLLFYLSKLLLMSFPNACGERANELVQSK